MCGTGSVVAPVVERPSVPVKSGKASKVTVTEAVAAPEGGAGSILVSKAGKIFFIVNKNDDSMHHTPVLEAMPKKSQKVNYIKARIVDWNPKGTIEYESAIPKGFDQKAFETSLRALARKVQSAKSAAVKAEAAAVAKYDKAVQTAATSRDAAVEAAWAKLTALTGNLSK